jgi:hypothetical protein
MLKPFLFGQARDAQVATLACQQGQGYERSIESDTETKNVTA